MSETSEIATSTLLVLQDGIEREKRRLASMDATRANLETHTKALGLERDGVVRELQEAMAKLTGVRKQQAAADKTAKDTVQAGNDKAAEIVASANAEARALVSAAHAKLAKAKAVLEEDAK